MQRVICRFCGRLRLLDSFCGEGGAGAGYLAAGFCVDAVDNSEARLTRYPVSGCRGASRILADALVYLTDNGHLYAAHHLSPPCTGYSRGTAALPDRLERYDRLIAASRDVVQTFNVPYVIENVEDAKSELRSPMTLCWTMFRRPGSVSDIDGTPLWVKRHRLFESNVPLLPRDECNHPPRRRGAPGWVQCAGIYGGARRNAEEARTVRKGGYVPASLEVLRELIGAPWMTEKGCQLSIPPVYAEHVGRQVLEALGA